MMKNLKTNFKLLKLVFKTIPFYAITSFIYTLLDAGSSLIDLFITEHVIELISTPNSTFEETLLFIIIAVGIRVLLIIFCKIRIRLFKSV